jgi:hypothetical protein
MDFNQTLKLLEDSNLPSGIRDPGGDEPVKDNSAALKKEYERTKKMNSEGGLFSCKCGNNIKKDEANNNTVKCKKCGKVYTKGNSGWTSPK